MLNVLDAKPVRRVGGGRRSVVVRYASRNMRRVIQAESRNVELVFVERCEHDPDVLFFCQPTTLSVQITDAQARVRRVKTYPDYLVLHQQEGFYFVECKPLSELQKSVASSGRFVREGSGWSWPAAEQAAAAFDLGYRVFTSETADRFWVRNVRYFSDFVSAACPDPEWAQAVADRVAAARSIRVSELLADADADPEILWWLLANGRIAADLQRELCFDLDTSWLHASHELMLAARHRPRSTSSHAFRPDLCALRAEPGRVLLWDDKPWTIVNVGADCITLRDDASGALASLPVRDFERLFAEGHLRATDASVAEEIDRQSRALVEGSTPKAVAAANRAFHLVKQADATGKVPEGPSPRALRRYRAWMRYGQERYGSEFLGLLRRRSRRSGARDLDAAQQALLSYIVRTFSKDRKAGRVLRAFDRLVALCDEVGVVPPSRETLRRELKAYKTAKLVRAREGARAAYQLEGPLALGLEGLPTVPDRVFELAHVDHTLLDVELASRTDLTSLVGRPWVTLMIDARSRLPLGMALSFNHPTRVALAEVLFDAVSRFHRVPDGLCVDQGPEFNLDDFEAVLGHLQMRKLERPATKPRFGAVVESMFAITNVQLVHELAGNTKLLRRQARTLSSSHHPTRQAVWTLPLLYEVLEKWLFEVYPGLRHGSLGASPREVFERDHFRSGERTRRYVRADAALRVLLAVIPDGGSTRKVDPVRGIPVDHLRYWHPDFARGDVGGSKVRVKVDPLDCAVAYAWVRGKWVTCSLADGDADLAGRSRKQVSLAIKELRQKHCLGAQARDVNAVELGRFLLEVEAKGELARQMQRDAEARALSSPATPSPARARCQPANRRRPRPPCRVLAHDDRTIASRSFHIV